MTSSYVDQESINFFGSSSPARNSSNVNAESSDGEVGKVAE